MADLTVVRAGKEVDHWTCPGLREALIDATCHQPARSVIVDLGGTEFINATGLAMLVGALKRAREQGCEFALARPGEHIRRILLATGLVKVFTVHPTLPEEATADAC